MYTITIIIITSRNKPKKKKNLFKRNNLNTHQIVIAPSQLASRYFTRGHKDQCFKVVGFASLNSASTATQPHDFLFITCTWCMPEPQTAAFLHLPFSRHLIISVCSLL